MSQIPHPNDPYGTEPGHGVPEQPSASEAPAGSVPAAGDQNAAAGQNPVDPYGQEASREGFTASAADEDQASPTSDPALHPHDPFAYSASAQPAGASADPEQVSAASPYGASAASASGTEDPYAASSGADAAWQAQPGSYDQSGQSGQAGQAGQGQYSQPVLAGPQGQHQQGQHQQGQPGQQGPYAQQQAPYPGPAGVDAPPPGTKGVYEGPLTGQPVNDSDARLWGMLSQLSVTLGHVISWGFLGWVGPLIIFLVYKDRNRFVRFHAAEALNGAISVVIAQVALSIVLGIFAIITLGIGSFLLVLVPVPALIQFVFSIIGAVKANQGQWWSYPLNIRLVK
ncbi:DUF4870 domain-containing protein [Brachybacterium alimentarium]|uniref:DUF4870 domain-containing protein n=1 Tax=Brachybacterium alimentarium TaxID=47845 RepID=UPI000DF3A815|nr:DUF4870 domain-containing protein [Brachybacterium alimentarium]RCS79958.1 DUF4870 domain-containing protein [Brachybacterium alimentarium]